MTSPPALNLTFLMIGCQRCGSTWIDAALREHPEVYLPAQKQTYFFDRNYDRGIDWYLGEFKHVGTEHRAVGEVATGYCLPEAIGRVALHLPDVKLLMTMRHPVERAYSNFKTRRAEQGWASFEAAVEADPDLLERGRYIEQVEAALEHYPREQLLLLLYDDLDRDDRAFLRLILEFIEVNPDFESNQFGQRRNAAMFPRVRGVMRSVGLGSTLRAISDSRVGDVVRRANKRRRRKGSDPIAPATRQRLIEYYQPLNDRLSALMGRNLEHWNR